MTLLTCVAVLAFWTSQPQTAWDFDADGVDDIALTPYQRMDWTASCPKIAPSPNQACERGFEPGSLISPWRNTNEIDAAKQCLRAQIARFRGDRVAFLTREGRLPIISASASRSPHAAARW